MKYEWPLFPYVSQTSRSVGGGNIASLVKVPVNKGTLLIEVSVATVRKFKSNVMGVWVEGEVHRLWKYVLGVRKSRYLSWPYVSVFNLRMRVCSSINLSVLLEKFPFKITHLRSEIE